MSLFFRNRIQIIPCCSMHILKHVVAYVQAACLHEFAVNPICYHLLPQLLPLLPHLLPFVNQWFFCFHLPRFHRAGATHRRPEMLSWRASCHFKWRFARSKPQRLGGPGQGFGEPSCWGKLCVAGVPKDKKQWLTKENPPWIDDFPGVS